MAALPLNWVQHGVYTPQQAANLLGINTALLSRWIYGQSKAAAAIVPQHPEHKGQFVTFLDLIQSMAIRSIRKHRKISLQKIRKTVLKARELQIDFPFATKHRTYVFNDDVVLRLDDGRLVQVTGRYNNNSLMEPVVYEYMEDIGFDDRGLASEYRPIRKAHRSVVLRPTLNYGAPTILPCGYTVSSLLKSYDAEGGSIERAADVCGVNPIDVQLAIAYEEKLAA